MTNITAGYSIERPVFCGILEIFTSLFPRRNLVRFERGEGFSVSFKIKYYVYPNCIKATAYSRKSASFMAIMGIVGVVGFLSLVPFIPMPFGGDVEFNWWFFGFATICSSIGIYGIFVYPKKVAKKIAELLAENDSLHSRIITDSNSTQ